MNHTAFAAEMGIPLSTLNNWQYGRLVRPPTARVACAVAKELEINVGWFLEGPPHEMRLDRSRPDARLEGDVAAWVRHEGARAAQAPAWIRDLLVAIIRPDVVIHELNRVAKDLVQRVWKMKQREVSFATVRAQLERDREAGSLNASAMKALATIESEDYFASAEHGGVLGRAIRAEQLESARRQVAPKPTMRMTRMEKNLGLGREAKRMQRTAAVALQREESRLPRDGTTPTAMAPRKKTKRSPRSR